MDSGYGPDFPRRRYVRCPSALVEILKDINSFVECTVCVHSIGLIYVSSIFIRVSVIWISPYYGKHKAFRYGPCVTRGSHCSVTCHPHTNHTCLYSPAARYNCPLAGTHCAYPRRDGPGRQLTVSPLFFSSKNGRPFLVVQSDDLFSCRLVTTP